MKASMRAWRKEMNSVKRLLSTNDNYGARNKMDTVSDELQDISELEHILAWICLQVSHIRGSIANIQKSHEVLKAKGETECRLQEFEDWRKSTAFTEREKAALSLAGALSTKQPETLFQPVLKEAKLHFNRQEMVRLTLGVMAANDWVDHHCDPPVRVLVVEDSPDDQELLRRQLRKARMESNVIFVSSAPEALDLLENSPESPFRYEWIAIFLDIQLPGMDGIDLLRRIRTMAKGEQIPVIVMTSSREPRHVEECTKLKVVSYVEKPVTYNAFSNAIANIFHKTKETAQLPAML